MGKIDLRYRKNFGLLITFLIFVTILFVTSLFLGRKITINIVETEFNNRKAEIFDETIKSFNEFFTEKIPEITYYQGYMDSLQASEFSGAVLRKYPFVQDVYFFDIAVSNRDSIGKGVRFNDLGLYSKNLYRFSLDESNKFKSKRLEGESSKQYADDFNNMMLKLISFLDRSNDSLKLSDNDVYKIFYSMQPGKISYLNIPRVSDLLVYKKMLTTSNQKKIDYEHDMFMFEINPRKLNIKNLYTNLYETITIKPVVDQYELVDVSYMSTEMPLPGALSEYKIQFETSLQYIEREIGKRFLPVLLGLVLIYIILLLIGYLIYRNVAINNRLYTLQYDFINNLTHEFKTPLSVIKIAGNNIKSAEKISDEERNMYGRILDQEADKLNSLMNKLLSFAQIENKSIKFKGENIDLNDFSYTFFEAVKIKYPDLNLKYQINVKRELYADPVLLSIVFQNLVDNAYKYSPVQRKILEVNIIEQKKNFIISFKDQGIGIDKKEFNSIFKKFYRVKNQFNQQGSIGLGLAFCKEITEFMGGDIKVESQVNVGTNFMITFPLDIKKI